MKTAVAVLLIIAAGASIITLVLQYFINKTVKENAKIMGEIIDERKKLIEKLLKV